MNKIWKTLNELTNIKTKKRVDPLELKTDAGKILRVDPLELETDAGKILTSATDIAQELL